MLSRRLIKCWLVSTSDVQVAPAELEGVLEEHDKISAAGVIGVTDTENSAGEVPAAFVQLAKNAEMTAEEVMSYVAEKVRVALYRLGPMPWASTSTSDNSCLKVHVSPTPCEGHRDEGGFCAFCNVFDMARYHIMFACWTFHIMLFCMFEVSHNTLT